MKFSIKKTKVIETQEEIELVFPFYIEHINEIVCIDEEYVVSIGKLETPGIELPFLYVKTDITNLQNLEYLQDLFVQDKDRQPELKIEFDKVFDKVKNRMRLIDNVVAQQEKPKQKSANPFDWPKDEFVKSWSDDICENSSYKELPANLRALSFTTALAQWEEHHRKLREKK